MAYLITIPPNEYPTKFILLYELYVCLRWSLISEAS